MDLLQSYHIGLAARMPCQFYLLLLEFHLCTVHLGDETFFTLSSSIRSLIFFRAIFLDVALGIATLCGKNAIAFDVLFTDAFFMRAS